MTHTAVPSRSSITFRSAAEADSSFLSRLYGTTREEEIRFVPWTPEQKTAFLDMQFQAQSTHYRQFYPNCEFLVIEFEGQPIGRLYIDRGEGDIRIIDIALVPEFRGRGIGRMLMDEILDEGRATGKCVTIHVERFNPALRLYERLGFRQIEDCGVYLFMEWRSRPAPSS